MGKLENMSQAVRFHGGILLRGIIRTLYGAATFGIVAGAVYGLLSIPDEGGYVAVFDFVASVAMLVVAVANMYEIGKNRRRGNGRA